MHRFPCGSYIRALISARFLCVKESLPIVSSFLTFRWETNHGLFLNKHIAQPKSSATFLTSCHSSGWGPLLFLPHATKLGQGYVFTCLWFCSQGGGGKRERGPRSLSRGGLRLGGGHLCPGRGSLSKEVSVRQGSLCPEGVFVWGGLCHGDPPYGNERAVRLLLECILVFIRSFCLFEFYLTNQHFAGLLTAVILKT